VTEIRVGLIGANPDTGWASRTHLPAIVANPALSLVAVCTTRAESARKAAEQYGARHALTDPAALVALSDVDLVVISVRAPSHAAMVELALAAGKPVLCEWPLGTGPEQSEKLAALAQARNVSNFVCLQGFASPGALATRALLEEGAIGKLLSVRMTGTFNPWGARIPASGTYLADAANGVSAASIIGGHALHMLARIAGDWATFSGTSANRRAQTRIAESGEIITQTSPDQFVASGVLACGAPVAVHLAGGIGGREEFELLVLGEGGALRLATLALPEILPPTLERSGEDGQFQSVTIEPRFRLAPASLGEGPAVNVAQLYAIIAAELDGGERCAPDFADALALRQLIARTAN
jgi:predicted dehydrogenase